MEQIKPKKSLFDDFLGIGENMQEDEIFGSRYCKVENEVQI